MIICWLNKNVYEGFLAHNLKTAPMCRNVMLDIIEDILVYLSKYSYVNFFFVANGFLNRKFYKVSTNYKFKY